MPSRFEPYASEQDYLEMVGGLLPKGKIWGIESVTFGEVWQESPLETDDLFQESPTALEAYQESPVGGNASGSFFGLFFSVIASELARIDADVSDLYTQTDPFFATDLLEDHQRELGLTGVSGTEEAIQSAAHSKAFDTGQTTDEAFWNGLAETFGFDITMTDGDPSANVCGVAVCGVAVCDGSGAYAFESTITITGGDGDVDLFREAVEAARMAHTWIWVVDGR
jgi:hypothetical protein